MDQSIARSDESTLVLRHVHHRNGALINQVVLEGLKRARTGSNHAMLQVTWVFLVFYLRRAKNAVVVDVHDAIIYVLIESLEDCCSGDRCTRYSTELTRCMRPIKITLNLI